MVWCTITCGAVGLSYFVGGFGGLVNTFGLIYYSWQTLSGVGHFNKCVVPTIILLAKL